LLAVEARRLLQAKALAMTEINLRSRRYRSSFALPWNFLSSIALAVSCYTAARAMLSKNS